MNFSVETR